MSTSPPDTAHDTAADAAQDTAADVAQDTAADARADAGTPAPPTAHDFDALYARSDDPWHFDGSWYEARKRRLLLASLPHARYARAFEPGCATGLLTAELAPRCDQLLASDGAERALATAAARLADQPQVAFARLWLPGDWPSGRFDLIVLSEFVYYLAPADIDRLAECVRESLVPGGVVAACHWRRPIDGCALAGDAVQERLHARMGLRQVTDVRDADFRLGVWTSAASASVADSEARG